MPTRKPTLPRREVCPSCGAEVLLVRATGGGRGRPRKLEWRELERGTSQGRRIALDAEGRARELADGERRATGEAVHEAHRCDRWRGRPVGRPSAAYMHDDTLAEALAARGS